MSEQATPTTLRHILVATDFGEAATQAEDVALTLARKFDAKVTLLHACILPPLPYGSGFALPLDAILEMAQQEVNAELAKLQSTYAKVEATVRTGSPTHAILTAAGDLGADLIVMGTQGRRGVARWVLGSVAENVLRLAPVPVLTVSPKASA